MAKLTRHKLKMNDKYGSDGKEDDHGVDGNKMMMVILH